MSRTSFFRLATVTVAAFEIRLNGAFIRVTPDFPVDNSYKIALPIYAHKAMALQRLCRNQNGMPTTFEIRLPDNQDMSKVRFMIKTDGHPWKSITTAF